MYADFFSEGMMHVLRVLEQLGGEAGGVHGAPPPHPEFGVSASQAVRGVCLGVG